MALLGFWNHIEHRGHRGFGAAWHGSGLFNHETHGIHEKEAWFFMKFHVFHGSGFGTTEYTEHTERHGAGFWEPQRAQRFFGGSGIPRQTNELINLPIN